MRKDVLIRDVDDLSYRRAKAAAAMRGIPMSLAVSEALENWANEENNEQMSQEYLKDLGFVKTHWKQIEKYKGKAIVVSSQKIQGEFGTFEEACQYSSRFKIALTFVVDSPPEERQIDFGPELEVQH